METIDIRPRPSLTAVLGLLNAVGLPSSDLTEQRLLDFWFCGPPGAPTGLIGLELYGRDGLVRSLAVAPAARRTGMGSALVRHAERHAVANGVGTLYLLTTTAQSFFQERGYRITARKACPGAIQSSAEFSSLCPASSAVLMKEL